MNISWIVNWILDVGSCRWSGLGKSSWVSGEGVAEEIGDVEDSV